MGDLRKNFDKDEFKCKHCGVYKDMDDSLLDGLQLLRDKYGYVHVNSGYRCASHPIESKKKTPGEHEKARAADIIVGKLSPMETLIAVLQIPQFKNGGIGIYPGKSLIHIDTKPGGKRRWSYINGVQRSYEDGIKRLK